MKITLKVTPKNLNQIPVLVLPISKDSRQDYDIELVKDFLVDNSDFGTIFDSQLLYAKSQKVLLLGIGENDKLNFATIQNWSGAAAKLLSKSIKSAAFILPSTQNLSPSTCLEAATIGIEVFAHDPASQFKSDYKQPKLKTVEILVDQISIELKKSLNKALIEVESINLIRQLGDTPANQMTPSVFLKKARQIALNNKLKLTVLEEKSAKKKGMGAFIGVAQGSDEPSYMIALEYSGDPKSKNKWGLVGKGITFDTGGISIKPASSMHEMKYDMLGAATVLGIIQATARLKLKENIVAIMAVTENLPGGRAQRPGDVVTSYSGKTAEILNTDAEGRLVLIDGLTWATKDFNADRLIDFATLTGAMVVSLGDFITGVFGNDPSFTQSLIKSGAEVGEKYWELPLDEEYTDMIKSDIADITNIGHGGSMPGAAGSITAAKFLEAVIDQKTPWIHLDIAGTAWDMKAKPYRGAGATGVGLKTILKLLSQ